MQLTAQLLRRSLWTEKFIGRTVIVSNGDVDGAMRVLNRIMGSEGLFDSFRRTRTYEKPWQTRRRVNWQLCKAIYDEDMDRKIKFVMRTNRVERRPQMLL